MTPLRWIGAILVGGALCGAAAATARATETGGRVAMPTLSVIARAADGRWRVESLGRGVYLFRWSEGAYVSVFVVGANGVLATDPINRQAAAAYREAVHEVTPLPITEIVYSHDHRDHIVGADVLAPDAEVIAHRNTLAHIRYRQDPDIRPPTRLVDDGDVIEVGGRRVGVHYFGPNHSDSNLALSFDTDRGQLLMFVDTLEIGIVPYRTLPDTNLRGYLSTLRAAAALHPDLVLGGHSGPGPGVWIDNYLGYLEAMRRSCARAMAAPQTEPDPEPEPAGARAASSAESIIASGEAHTNRVVRAVMEELRPRYGSWLGFEAWAPLNIQAMMMFLTIGN
jgi:glyoxylase-like metal-dependent hydrolase (beta-lactamase superfamily II)